MSDAAVELLEPDRDQIEIFVDALFRHAGTGGYVSLRSFLPNSKVLKPIRAVVLNGNGSLVDLVDVAVDQARRAANNQIAAVFCPPIAVFQSREGWQAREEDLLKGLALSVECDQRADAARWKLEELLGPATVIVRSGGTWIDPDAGTPQDKLHLHWRLKQPAMRPSKKDDPNPLLKLKQARELAAAIVGADPTNVPVVHCLRRPGSWHRKAAPRLCEIFVANPDAEIDLETALAALQIAAPPIPQRKSDAAASNPGDWSELTGEIVAGRNLHGSIVRLAARYIKSGMSGGAAVNQLRGLMDNSAARQERPDEWQDRRDDIVRAVETAEEKYAEPEEPRPQIVVPADATNEDRAPAFTDEALALHFAEQHADLRYVAAWSRWLVWNGRQWLFDDTLHSFDLARRICREAATECNKRRMASALASAKTVAAVERLAKADRRVAATVGQWDTDPWLLNTPAGIVDLRTGNIQSHDPKRYMTKMTAVAAGGDCPIWHAFLDRITDKGAELISFLRRMAGYSLTGITREHAMFFGYGTGANGKSVFVKTISEILGDYHKTAPIETFTASSGERHPTDLAGLRGARLVTAIETEEGRRWAESKIKAMTGGDQISARFMRQDFFEYSPQFKLLIAGNHKPGLRSVDEAIRRRLNLIPFTVTIPPDERDETLTARLKTEWPGILQWMIDGCADWLEQGLQPPEAVTLATAAYLEAQDAVGAWVEECIELARRDPTAWVSEKDLFESWTGWASAAGEYVGTRPRLMDKLVAKGFEPRRRKNGRGLLGLLVKNPYDAVA